MLRAAVDRARDLGPRGLVQRYWGSFVQLARIALACALAELLAADVLGTKVPVLAPLAALLTVQITVVETVSRGVQQVIGVIVGVLAAGFLAQWLGLTPWSVGGMIFLALAVGRLLRLGPQANQVAVSALLVLGLGSGYGETRIADTLLGAAVGVLVNALVAPPTFVDDAVHTVADLAQDVAELLRTVGRDLTGSWDEDTAQGWLRRARRLGVQVAAANEAVERAEESRRFNPRGLRRTPVVTRLREAVTCLDHVVHQLRGICRTLLDADTPVPSAYAEALLDAGAAFTAFARLQTAGEGGDRDALRQRVAAARERHRAATAAMQEQAGREGQWAAFGSLLADLGRVLDEVDPVEGAHTAALPGV